LGDRGQIASIQPFWGAFSDRFFKPPQENLETSVLYANSPFGWYPKLDLRTVYSPKLRSLTIVHRIFHHAHQIEWITSHAALKQLFLDRCFILYQIGHTTPDWLDDEGYKEANEADSINPDYGYSLDPVYFAENVEVPRLMQFASISMRWCEIFPRFAAELPGLHIFKVGSSTQCDFGSENRLLHQGICYSLPIMPWDDEMNIKNPIFEETHVTWDD
jgi:hypothetical protein